MKTTLTPYQQHKQRWSNCHECPLCETRRHVVLARGTIPCDVLFIGEAPGESEDVLGKPFVGPAGQLLDRIIESAWESVFLEVRPATFAFTNLVACIPLGEDRRKVSEPTKEWIEACRERLVEFVEICDPKLVVGVGALAKKNIPSTVLNDRKFVDLIHPAAILRMNVAQQGLAAQRCVVTLTDALEEL